MPIINILYALFFVCHVFIGEDIQAHEKKPSSVFILVHGTWGADGSWYTPKGEFFQELEKTVITRNSTVVSFRWSGGCGHESRVKAAHDLVALIKKYEEDVAIFLVAHSHGGNVGALASHVLAQDVHNKHHIRALFTLGTPIMSTYFPNMSTIHYLYNLFSFEDIIQTVLGISLREYPRHRRIANLRLFINGKEPDHAQLRDPVVGKWLPYVHQHFKQYLRDQGIDGHISEPSIVYIDSDTLPRYMPDSNRTDLLERDRQLSVLILNSLRNSLETGSNIPLTNL